MEHTSAIEAIFFDMDGVLIDSENHWLEVGNKLVERWVTNWSKSDYPKVMGLSVEPLYNLLVSDYGLEAPLSDFLDDYSASIESIYLEKTQLIPGVIDLLEDISGRYRTAIVTSSNSKNIDIVNDRFKLGKYFEKMMSISDFSCEGKPAPDVYIEAAKCLGVNTKNVLAIEDSSVGVQSAHSAGMTVFGLKNGFNNNQDLSLAHHLLDGFEGVTLEQLESEFVKHST